MAITCVLQEILECHPDVHSNVHRTFKGHLDKHSIVILMNIQTSTGQSNTHLAFEHLTIKNKLKIQSDVHGTFKHRIDECSKVHLVFKHPAIKNELTIYTMYKSTKSLQTFFFSKYHYNIIYSPSYPISLSFDHNNHNNFLILIGKFLSPLELEP